MPTIEFDPSEGVTSEQQAAEANALAQGEKIAEMNEADRNNRLQQQEDSQEQTALIGGKFKSQDDLLKAYNELQKKLGTPNDESTDEPVDEGLQTEGEQEAEEVNVGEGAAYMLELSKEYSSTGALSDEAMERLSSMDQKDLINSYFEYQAHMNQQAGQQQLANDQVRDIQNSVGGAEAYSQLITWASQNLSSEEINDFNSITNDGNVAAARFAVEALSSRYKQAEGYEAPLVTGKAAGSGVKPFRSQAELARAIADPLYSQDPAYRMDVEARLAKSKDLL
jgi:hypothetical protein